MTPAQVIALNPTAFRQTLEDRVAELSGLLHVLAAELAILQSELPLLRSGHKSSLEVKAALMTWEMSVERPTTRSTEPLQTTAAS
jgi:hypothetical protein